MGTFLVGAILVVVLVVVLRRRPPRPGLLGPVSEPPSSVRVIPRGGSFDLGRLLWHPRVPAGQPLEVYDWQTVPSLARVDEVVVDESRADREDEPPSDRPADQVAHVG